MKFGLLALDEAEGAILAHTVRWKSGTLRKGIRLDRARIALLREAGVGPVMAAREDADDVHEDEAARKMAASLAPEPEACGLRRGPARRGRVNFFALHSGLLRVERDAITAFNRVSETAAISTLPEFARTSSGQLVATVKVIPFAVSRETVARATESLVVSGRALEVLPVRRRSAAILATRGEWTPPSLQARGMDVVRSRLRSLGIVVREEREVSHAAPALAEALAGTGADMILVLGDTVTSDREDVAPSAIRLAGGTVRRFGMPVDPGNLLLLGDLNGRPVLVLPGCARSPKLNGADWVLERIACGVFVDDRAFAAMGVGGLLHEIASRPSPRLGGADVPDAPRIPILLLAAGASRRMARGHKLLRSVDGVPLVAHVADRLSGSRASRILAVVGAESGSVGDALRSVGDGTVEVLENELYREGIGSSIRKGVAAVGSDADALVVALADMPEVEAADIDRLIDAYDPAAGSGICRLVGPEGEPGHPVLLGRRYFEALGALSGDRGARDVLLENRQDVRDLRVPASRLVDLDTEDQWRRWRADREGKGETTG